jgi:hypothetical protein
MTGKKLVPPRPYVVRQKPFAMKRMIMKRIIGEKVNGKWLSVNLSMNRKMTMMAICGMSPWNLNPTIRPKSIFLKNGGKKCLNITKNSKLFTI